MNTNGKSRDGTDRGAPEKPTSLPLGSWGGVIKRTIREFREDNLTDWAAALTYYSVLSVFPALIAFVSIVALVFLGGEISKIISEIGDSM